jgi:hypothetical protein
MPRDYRDDEMNDRELRALKGENTPGLAEVVVTQKAWDARNPEAAERSRERQQDR